MNPKKGSYEQHRFGEICVANPEAIFPHGIPIQPPFQPMTDEDYRAILFGSHGSCGVHPRPEDYRS